MLDVRNFNLICNFTESGESEFSTTYCGYPIVLAGCLNQIDTPQVTRRNNGLAYALKLLGGKSQYCAVCTFADSEITRSKLAAEVSTAINNFEK